MTGPPSREQQAEARREQLTATALELFAAKGWAGTTIKDLAEAAGVAPGLIYHYFPGKEALLTAAVERYSFLPELRRILTVHADEPAGEVLLEVVTRFARLLDERQALVRLFVTDAQTQPVVQASWRRVTEEGSRLIGSYLTARIAAGELRPHNVAVTAQGLMASVLFGHLRGVLTESWLTDLVDQFLHGVAAPSRESRNQ